MKINPCKNCGRIPTKGIINDFGYQLMCTCCGVFTATYETEYEAEREWNRVNEDER